MTRTAVIMQPTYLPWLGYFDLIDQCDVCVFLEDAQFCKQSWHQRNRIRTPSGLQWLTVPVKRKGRLRVALNEMEIVTDTGFPRDHIRGIELNYTRTPFFRDHFPALLGILSEGETHLSALNMRLIRWLAGELGVAAEFATSSGLKAVGRRTDLMIDICRRVGADSYLSPAGSTYIETELDPSKCGGLSVRFHNYDHPVYRQAFEPFIPYASVIDLLFNEGEDSLGIIRSGRRQPLDFGNYKRR